MSYCRWSSDNFMCDLYCYEDVNGGWTTHVARSRPARRPQPEMPDLISGTIDVPAWLEAHNAMMADLDTIPRVPIGGPHDGQSFNDATLEEFRDRLLMLRAAGYRFPDGVLAAVEEEIAESIDGVS